MSAGHTVHSPEKLEFKASTYAPNTYRLGTEGGDWLMAVLHNGEQVEARQEANMRRLVACWNACDGSSTGWLEFQTSADRVDQFGPPEPFETRYTKELQKGVAFMEQRNALLELLDQVVKAFDEYDNGDEIELTAALRNRARKAIAKVTGGTV